MRRNSKSEDSYSIPVHSDSVFTVRARPVSSVSISRQNSFRQNGSKSRWNNKKFCFCSLFLSILVGSCIYLQLLLLDKAKSFNVYDDCMRLCSESSKNQIINKMGLYKVCQEYCSQTGGSSKVKEDEHIDTDTNEIEKEIEMEQEVEMIEESKPDSNQVEKESKPNSNPVEKEIQPINQVEEEIKPVKSIVEKMFESRKIPQPLKDDDFVNVQDNLSLYEQHLKKLNNLYIWLDANRGVTVSGESSEVQNWKDQSKFGYVFHPTDPETHVHRAFGHEDHESKNGEPLLKSEKLGKGRSIVQFPCALESHDAKLETEMTMLFVISPNEFLNGPAASGQRFFGHYPDGQFRFSDGFPSYYSAGDRKMSTETLKSNHGLILLKYKLMGQKGIMIGVNDGPFEKTYDEAIRMSNKISPLTVGGSGDGCGFRGGIAEVLVFKGILDDSIINDHVDYLKTKWWTDLSETFPENKISNNNNNNNNNNNIMEFVAITPTLDDETERPEFLRKNDIDCEQNSTIENLERINDIVKKNPISLWMVGSQGVTENDQNQVQQWQSIHASGENAVIFSNLGVKNIPMKKSHYHRCNHFVDFGCSLVASGISLQFPLTAYFVAKPGTITGMERLFGHFPNGGFIIDGYTPLFKTKHGFLGMERERKNLRTDKNEPTHFQLYKYRIGDIHGIEAGVGNTQFYSIGSIHDGLFSFNKKISLGGTNGGCEFTGSIGEIMFFSGTIDDIQDEIVSNFLMGKWGLNNPNGNAKIGNNAQQQKQKCSKAYTSRNDDPMTWVPTIEETTLEQRNEWTDVLNKEQKLIARATQIEKGMVNNQASARLKEARERIFGKPCASQKSLKSPPTPTNTASKNINCKREFTTDILNWKMPSNTPVEIKFQWEDIISNAKQKIASISYGGDQLTAVLLEMSQLLNQQRDDLFSDICDKGNDKVETKKKTTTTATKTTLTKTNSAKVKCSTKSVMEWEPPSEADMDSKFEWKDAIGDAKNKIAGFTKGGAPLDAFLKQLVRNLEKQRIKLFENVCNNLNI